MKIIRICDDENNVIAELKCDIPPKKVTCANGYFWEVVAQEVKQEKESHNRGRHIILPDEDEED